MDPLERPLISTPSNLVVGQHVSFYYLSPCTQSPTSSKFGRLDKSWGQRDDGSYLPNRDVYSSLGPWLTKNPELMSMGLIATPYIVGPDIVCTSNAIFTLNQVPGGQSVTWSANPSGLFVTSSGSGTTATLRANSSSSKGSATLTFQLSPGANCENSIFTKNILVGTPDYQYLQVRDYYTKVTNPSLCLYNNNYLEVFMSGETAAQQGVDYWGWNVISGGDLYPLEYPYDIANAIPNSSYFTFQYRAHNACGWSSFMNSTLNAYSCGYSYSYSPNPVENELTIEAIPESDSIEMKSALIIEFKVSLYNSNNQLIVTEVSRENKVVLNTTDLKGGNYIMHISDKDQVIKEHIIIE